MTQADLPAIPQKITIHLGPPDSNAQNVTIGFTDYIKNIASGEIYPTWNENAIRANILALTSFALNRIETEHYSSQGYDFDITNQVPNDPNYVYERATYPNISQAVDSMYSQYIRRGNMAEPLYAQYCDGVEMLCPGLSKWGSVDLADQGKTTNEILAHYYGDDIIIVTDAAVEGINSPAPIRSIKLGDYGNNIKTIQAKLNRIGYNYTDIPKIPTLDGVYSYTTEDAVMQFQRIFGLREDGIIGRETWYKIMRVYEAIKNLNKLDLENDIYERSSKQLQQVFTHGSSGEEVKALQYMLTYISLFNDKVREPKINGIFDDITESSVRDFQNSYGLPADGIIGPLTYASLYNAYRGSILNIDPKYIKENIIPYEGVVLKLGSFSESVRLIQEYLNYIGKTYTEIPPISVTGHYGFQTQNSVETFKRLFGIEPLDGIVDQETWTEISNVFSDLFKGNMLNDGQFPGVGIG